MFLTYSQVPEEWTKESVLTRLKEKFEYNRCSKEHKKYESKVIMYVIGEEKHEEKIGEGNYERGKHFHIFLELQKKQGIKEADFLDIEGIHGNYQTVKNKNKVIAYCRKGGDYIESANPEVQENELLSAKDEQQIKGYLFDRMSVK